MNSIGPIGVFDSGFGGLTVQKNLTEILPDYDYLYLGDNARTPYGTRSFDAVYQYSLECIKYLFDQACPLIIVACNTASAKALRTIQQNDLGKINPDNRVLGVIRPTTEIIGNISKSRTVGILGTTGTVKSESYIIEIEKFFPDIRVIQEACPMWVPLVENNEFNNAGADYFIRNNIDNLLAKSSDIDTVILACTHYPLLYDKIRKYLPEKIKLISQGEIVANSLQDYLQRHPEIESRLTKNAGRKFLTTDDSKSFDEKAEIFYGQKIESEQIHLNF